MRSRFIALLVGSSAGALALAAVACGRSDDGAASDNANLTAAAGADPAETVTKRLTGAWVRQGGSGDGDLALTVSSFIPETIGLSRDRPHKPTSELDTQEVEREGQQVKLLSVSGDSGGTFEWLEVESQKDGLIKRTTTYSFTIASSGSTDTLTLTPTGVKVETVGNAEAPKSAPLDPPEKFTRASSWCAKTTSVANPKTECGFALRIGTWNPTDMPLECKGKEDICTTCENHECKVQAVSSCELTRFSCFDTIEQCEFDVGGKPTGQVAVIDTKGNPIDCKKSPTKKPVCCQNLSPVFKPTGGGPIVAPTPPPP
jgi:hypothetical protein